MLPGRKSCLLIPVPMWEPSCHHAPPCSASKQSMTCCEPPMHAGNALLQTHEANLFAWMFVFTATAPSRSTAALCMAARAH